MADNVPYTPGTGVTIAADDIGGTHFQRVKVVLGSDGTNLGDVGPTNPVPATGTVSVLGSVSVSGTALVSMVPGASVSVLNVANTVGTVLGTVNVAIVAGAGGGGSVTTAGPSISATGQVMWLAGGQGTTANPVVMTGVVQVSAGTTNISGTVSVNTVAVLNTVVTVLSTVNVAIVAGAGGGGSVTTAGPSISATGQVVWIAGGQGTTATPIWVTGTVAAGAGTTVVSIGNVVPVTTAASVSVTGLPVWLNPTQPVVVNTIAAGFSVNALVTGAVSISAMPGVSIVGIVPVTTAASVSVTGLPVWMNPTQQVVVSGLAGHAVSLTNIVPITTAASVSVTGLPVWLNPTQQVSIASVQLQPVNIMISSTVVGSSTTMLMTVYTGATFVTTGASFWVVPAGKVFRVMAMNIVNVSSAVLGNGRLVVVVGTAAASVSVVATAGIAAALPYMIQGTANMWNREGIVADIAAGTTVGVGVQGGTSQSVQAAVISGYLF